MHKRHRSLSVKALYIWLVLAALLLVAALVAAEPHTGKFERDVCYGHLYNLVRTLSRYVPSSEPYVATSEYCDAMCQAYRTIERLEYEQKLREDVAATLERCPP